MNLVVARAGLSEVRVDGWIEWRHARGADAVIGVYLELLEGHPDPTAGFICSLVDER